MFLDEISDDWLICLYREGNQDAIDLLYKRYTVFLYGFIKNILSKDNKFYDFDELYQDLFIVFLNCLDRYDEENGCFYFFVKQATERKLFDIINKTRRQEKISSLDDIYYPGGSESIVDYIEEESNEEYYNTELYKTIKSKVSQEELKIIDLKVEGYNYQEIANKIGVNKQCVYRKVVGIKKLIKDIIEKID